MKSVTQIALETVEETRQKFFDLYGKNSKDQKRLFINWYFENHNAPFEVLVHDLANYYLHISEDTIKRYLSEQG